MPIHTRLNTRQYRPAALLLAAIVCVSCGDSSPTVGTDVEVLIMGDGDGTGRVIASEAIVGIDCLVGPSVPAPGSCESSFFDAGEGGVFNLLATANPGSSFQGWTGCNEIDLGECVLEFDGLSRSERFEVTATFASDPADTCNTTFGTSPGYLLCAEDATTCTFYTLLNNIDSCTTRCADFGSTCVRSVRDQDDTCTPGAVQSCDDVIGDRLCTCEKP